MGAATACSNCKVYKGKCPDCDTFWTIVAGKRVGFPLAADLYTIACNLSMALANARGGFLDTGLCDAVLAQAEAAGIFGRQDLASTA